MKKILVIIYLLVTYSFAVAQGCLPEGKIITTQTQIDYFSVLYPGCTEVEGDLTIGETGNNIVNLDGLSVLTKIRGNLTICYLQGVSSLSGLQNIDSIGGNLTIKYNPDIVTLQPLDSLRYIGGDLAVFHNNLLESFSGLDSLNTVGGSLIIQLLPVLQQINALQSLQVLGGGVELYDLPLLQNLNPMLNFSRLEGMLLLGGDLGVADLSAFSSLTGLGSNLYITGTSLTSLNGLQNLTKIEGRLEIVIDNSITSLAGLSGLDTIQGDLFFYGLGKLKSMNGLADLKIIQGNCFIVNLDSIVDLTGIGSLSKIGGEFSIQDMDRLDDFSGLNSLDTIGGKFTVLTSKVLASMEGLQNLHYVGGNLEISMNRELQSLSGLNALERVEGDLLIERLLMLDNLEGLDALQSIGGSFSISHNAVLQNVNGISDLTEIGGDLVIWNNPGLESLQSFSTLGILNGKLLISENDSLETLAGIDNILPQSITEISINDNPLLSDCSADAICSFLANPMGPVNIYNNASGCNKHAEVSASCGLFNACLPYGNYYLSSQADVDAFPLEYPDCIDLNGSISIAGEDVISLDSLIQIQSISGDLFIGRRDETNTNLLTNLQGLNSISGIGGSLIIEWTDALHSLDGLNNLQNIGSDLRFTNNYNLADISALGSMEYLGNDVRISGCTVLNSLDGLQFLDTIHGNLILEQLFELNSFNALENLRWVGKSVKLRSCLRNTLLTGLDSLNYIGNGLELSMGAIVNLDALSQLTDIGNGELSILDCFSLRNIDGIRNINSESISRLQIMGNTRLFHCEVESICGFLQIAPGLAYIGSNRLGCNSVNEINEACLSVDSKLTEYSGLVQVFPNPAGNWLTILLPEGTGAGKLVIYSITGEEISVMDFPGDTKVMNVESLPAGMYIFRLNTHKAVYIGKFVKY
jgi:hypothetical protein